MYLRYIHIQGSEERYLLGQNKTKPTNCRGNPFCQATKRHSTAKRSKTLAVILVSDYYFTVMSTKPARCICGIVSRILVFSIVLVSVELLYKILLPSGSYVSRKRPGRIINYMINIII